MDQETVEMIARNRFANLLQSPDTNWRLPFPKQLETLAEVVPNGPIRGLG